MSVRLRCDDCGWHRHYRDPRDAHRAATGHRCDTTATGGPHPTPAPSRTPAEASHGHE
jgi:hypothetical protein